jgi:hypothetical protein
MGPSHHRVSKRGEDQGAIGTIAFGGARINKMDFETQLRDYPLNIQVEIRIIFHNLEESRDYEYMDNYRVANIKNISQVHRYNNISDDGCCGSFDKEFVIFEETYKIGFNYGH